MLRVTDPRRKRRAPVLAIAGAVVLLLGILAGGPAIAGEDGSHPDHQQEANGERDFGVLHPVMVHFPLALSAVAALALVMSGLSSGSFFRHSATYTSVLAAVASVPAYLLGQAAEESMGRMSASREALVSNHETWGLVAMIVLLTAAAARLLSLWRSDSKPLRWAAVILILGAAAVLGYTGFLGGEVVRGQGHMDAFLP